MREDPQAVLRQVRRPARVAVDGRPVGSKELCGLLEREAKKRARDERFARGVAEIRERLAAQVAAVSVEGA